MPVHPILQKTGWIAFGTFAILIGFYPAVYYFAGNNFGFLNTKPASLLENPWWRTGFFTHISFGAVALLTGWTQFSTRLREWSLTLHRTLGKIYVIAVVLSSTAAIGIAFFATAGIVASAGFVGLGVTWISTTIMAYLQVRKLNIDAHQQLMIYSYAACFAAVTLRIWLPLLSAGLGDFNTAYRIVAWLCWVPNMLVALWIVRSGFKGSIVQKFKGSKVQKVGHKE